MKSFGAIQKFQVINYNRVVESECVYVWMCMCVFACECE